MKMRQSEDSTITYRFRMVVARHGKKSQRWRWAVERTYRVKMDEWELEKDGFAWTFSGAQEKAQKAMHPYDIHRLEAIMLWSKPYTPREKKPSPLPVELLPDACPATASRAPSV